VESGKLYGTPAGLDLVMLSPGELSSLVGISKLAAKKVKLLLEVSHSGLKNSGIALVSQETSYPKTDMIQSSLCLRRSGNKGSSSACDP
jgi:hypothetical protein